MTLYDKTAESAEQDQAAHMCRLILLYTFCKIIPWQDNGQKVLNAGKDEGDKFLMVISSYPFVEDRHESDTLKVQSKLRKTKIEAEYKK